MWLVPNFLHRFTPLTLEDVQLSSDQNLGYLLYIWDYPFVVGVIISHHKDPYEPISIMECHKGFLNVAQPPFQVR